MPNKDFLEIRLGVNAVLITVGAQRTFTMEDDPLLDELNNINKIFNG